MNSGWYDSTLDDHIASGNLSAGQKHIDWLVANTPKGLPTTIILYCSTSLFKKSVFPLLLEYGSVRGINFYLAVSSIDSAKDAIKYNTGKPQSKQIKGFVTELEPYRGTVTYDYMTGVLKGLKTLGLPFAVYMGRPLAPYWSTIFKYTTELNLHCYLKSYDEISIWNYYKTRLNEILQTCVTDKISQVKLNLLVSDEPLNPTSGEEFGYNYFKTHSWNEPLKNFLSVFAKKANAEMKKRFIIGDEIIFKVKYGLQLKP